MARHRHRHRHLRPPEHDTADAGRRSGAVDAGAPLSDISRRLYRTKPNVQLRLFGLVLARLESADDGRIVWSTLTDADLTATGAQRAAHRGADRPPRQSEDGRGRHPVQGGRRRDADQRPHARRRCRRDRADRSVRWGGHARAAGATSPCRSPMPAPSLLRRSASWRFRTLSVARTSLGPGPRRHPRGRQAGRPTSHDIVALVRRLAASKRSATAARSTVRLRRPAGLPRPRDAGCRVPPGRRQGIPGDGLLRRPSTTDDLEGELTPSRRSGATRAPSRRACLASPGTITQRPPAFSAIRSVAGAPTRWPGPVRRSTSPSARSPSVPSARADRYARPRPALVALYAGGRWVIVPARPG